MNYRINTEVFSNIFVLPSSIVDEHLRLSGTLQLRVILWLFRHSGELPVSPEVIAKALGIDPAEANDALIYWTENGILSSDSVENKKFESDFPQENDIQTASASEKQPEEAAFVTSVISAQEEAEKSVDTGVNIRRHTERITVNPPTHEEVAKRLTQSRDLREIFQTAEERLGMTLSYNMQSTLVMLYDDYGLSAAVIALLIEYAENRKKPTQRFIANTGKIWCDMEIDTLEKAMDYIEEQNKGEKIWAEFRELAGVKNPSPTKSQREFLRKWRLEMGFNMEMILLAYEEMANNTDKFSFPYMNKVLTNWKKDGLKTPDDVERAKKERAEKLRNDKETESGKKPKSGGAKPSEPASYNLGDFTKMAFRDPTKIMKKGSV